MLCSSIYRVAKSLTRFVSEAEAIESSACAKCTFRPGAKSTRLACPRGERGGPALGETAPPISDVLFSRPQKPLPANLKPVASLFRQPLLGQGTIFWAPTNRTPSKRPSSRGGLRRGLTGHGMPSLWIIALLWSSAKEMWAAKSTSRFSLQITLLMIRERRPNLPPRP